MDKGPVVSAKAWPKDGPAEEAANTARGLGARRAWPCPCRLGHNGSCRNPSSVELLVGSVASEDQQKSGIAGKTLKHESTNVLATVSCGPRACGTLRNAAGARSRGPSLSVSGTQHFFLWVLSRFMQVCIKKYTHGRGSFVSDKGSNPSQSRSPVLGSRACRLTDSCGSGRAPPCLRTAPPRPRGTLQCRDPHLLLQAPLETLFHEPLLWAQRLLHTWRLGHS